MAGRTIEVSGIPFIPNEQLLVDFLEDVLGNGSLRACRLIRSRRHEKSSSNRCETEGDRKVRAIVETESAESATTLHNLAKAKILVFWCAALAVKFVSCPDPDHSFPPDLNIHDVPSDPEVCVYEENSPIEILPLEAAVEQICSIKDLPLKGDVEQKSVIEDADVEQKSSREGLPLEAAVEEKSSIEDLPLKADVEQKYPMEDLPLEADVEQKSSSIGGLLLQAAVEQKSCLEDFPLESDVEQKSATEGLPLESDVEQKSGLPLEADVEQESPIEDHLQLEAYVIVSKVAPDINFSEPKQLSEPIVSVSEVVHESKAEPGPKNHVPKMFTFRPINREPKVVREPEILSSLPKDRSIQRLEKDGKLGPR